MDKREDDLTPEEAKGCKNLPTIDNDEIWVDDNDDDFASAVLEKKNEKRCAKASILIFD